MIAHASGSVAGFIVGTLLTASGFFMAYSVGKPLRDQAAASIAWPTADGRITGSQLERSKSRGETMYSADVAYEYSVDGRNFEGDRVWFGDDFSSSNPTPWRKVVDRYAAGTDVKVFYAPADPVASVLEPGATWSSSGLYVVGLGLLTLGVLILLSSLAPLLLVVAALLGFLSPKDSDPRDDFDRPAGGSRASGGDAGDDGIVIG